MGKTKYKGKEYEVEDRDFIIIELLKELAASLRKRR